MEQVDQEFFHDNYTLLSYQALIPCLIEVLEWKHKATNVRGSPLLVHGVGLVSTDPNLYTKQKPKSIPFMDYKYSPSKNLYPKPVLGGYTQTDFLMLIL
jgi:hypothetical protein